MVIAAVVSVVLVPCSGSEEPNARLLRPPQVADVTASPAWIDMAAEWTPDQFKLPVVDGSAGASARDVRGDQRCVLGEGLGQGGFVRREARVALRRADGWRFRRA